MFSSYAITLLFFPNATPPFFSVLFFLLLENTPRSLSQKVPSH